VRQRGDPVVGGLELGHGAVVGHVARVDEDVAVGQAGGAVIVVRVGDADDAEFGSGVILQGRHIFFFQSAVATV